MRRSYSTGFQFFAISVTYSKNRPSKPYRQITTQLLKDDGFLFLKEGPEGLRGPQSILQV